MPFSSDHDKTQLNSKKSNSIFVFLGGHNFWEGLYDTVNISFIQNLVDHQLIEHTDVLMTTIIPKGTPQDKIALVNSKAEKLSSVLQKSHTNISYYHIQGRNIRAAIKAAKDIHAMIRTYDQKFIWAQNYFNTLIGVLIKRKRIGAHLHFDMRGLAPQEELHYSQSNFFSRVFKFLILLGVERINLVNADSISTVSKRFAQFLQKKYPHKNLQIEILPNYIDHNQLHYSEILREQFRQKYQILDGQYLVLYSGMLQKWQDPDLLFAFIKHIQDQDVDRQFRFIVLTFDQAKARQFAAKYQIKDLIIDQASAMALNGIYNAADIGIAFRDQKIASVVSSPVKISEYLVTGNCLILLESIGDFGQDLKDKPYVLLRKDRNKILETTLEEIKQLKCPDPVELAHINEMYSIHTNIKVIRRIINQTDG